MLEEEGKSPKAPRLRPGIRCACCCTNENCRLEKNLKPLNITILNKSSKAQLYKSVNNSKFKKYVIYID